MSAHNTRIIQLADTVYRTIINRIEPIRGAKTFELRAASLNTAFHLYLSSGRVYVLSDTTKVTTVAECIDAVGIITSRLEDIGLRMGRIGDEPIYDSVTHMDIEPVDKVTVQTAKITDYASFFRRICLTYEQRQLVHAELPVGAPEDDLLWLSCFRDNVLRRCGLSDVQIVMWEKLIGELCA